MDPLEKCRELIASSEQDVEDAPMGAETYLKCLLAQTIAATVQAEAMTRMADAAERRNELLVEMGEWAEAERKEIKQFLTAIGIAGDGEAEPT